MQILTPAGWAGPYADYHRPAESIRIRVAGVATVERIETLYFEQPRDLRRVWNYVREVGPVQVARKIRSRTREGVRNDKYLWIGAGRGLEGPDRWVGACVLFVATAHPKGVERIVVPDDLLVPIEDASLATWVRSYDGPPVVADAPSGAGGTERELLVGWSPDSGIPLPIEAARGMLDRAQTWMPALLEAPGPDVVEESTPVWPGSAPVAEVVSGTSQEVAGATGEDAPERTGTTDETDALLATLFGYGHYAKISLIPNLDDRIRVVRVHEIDPTQVGPAPHEFTMDTSSSFRPADAAGTEAEGRMDVAFLAGFHHTHAPLAAEALRRGAHAVIEKPIATRPQQLDELADAMASSPGSVHVGFHKRHQPFNEWAREDLAVQPGDPVSYYCIAYEVPLPKHHWYRWPNSGSRLLSNGCHWVDHFLFLNDFSPVRSLGVEVFPSGDLSAHVVLENDAAFHMILTDQGGRRIGVQDHIELRLGTRTARIRNASLYESEDDRRILRKESENKTNAYAAMYGEISRAIAEGRTGDSVEQVRRSGGTVLELEARFQHATGGHT